MKLDYRNKNLIELNYIPDLIEKIDCGVNKIVTLDNLSESLKILICDSNKLVTLDYLPESLEILICDYNPIKQLDNLPSGLKKLSCMITDVKNLNNLPKKLYELNCHYCEKIESLENLPSELKILDCSKLFNLHYSKLKLPQKLNKLKITNQWWYDNNSKQIRINGKELNLIKLIENISEEKSNENKKEILKEHYKITEFKEASIHSTGIYIPYHIEVLINDCLVNIQQLDYCS